jgi:hypothetical protein
VLGLISKVYLKLFIVTRHSLSDWLDCYILDFRLAGMLCHAASKISVVTRKLTSIPKIRMKGLGSEREGGGNRKFKFQVRRVVTLPLIE